MFFRLLAESLRRGRRRKLLAATAVALGTFAVTALGGLLLAARDRLAAEMSSYGANLEVTASGGETFAVDGLESLGKIFWRNNIVAVAPLYPLRARLTSAAGTPADGRVATLVGTWFAHPLIDGRPTGLPSTRPALAIDGRWPRDGAREVALGRRLAALLGIGPGGRIAASLAGRRVDLAVVGVVGGGGPEEEQAIAPLEVVEELAGRPGRTVRAEVFALTVPEPTVTPDPRHMSAAEYDAWYCTAYPSAVAFQIGEAIPGATAGVVRGVAAASGELLRKLQVVLLFAAVIVLTGTILGVTAAMTATVMERQGEAGLFAALGAEWHRVARFFLTEAALLGLLGGTVGGLAGLGASRLLGRWVFGTAVPWLPALLPVAVGLGLVVALAGSLPPVVRALARRPARTLAGSLG